MKYIEIWVINKNAWVYELNALGDHAVINSDRDAWFLEQERKEFHELENSYEYPLSDQETDVLWVNWYPYVPENHEKIVELYLSGKFKAFTIGRGLEIG